MTRREHHDGTFFYDDRKGIWIGRTPRYIVNGKQKRREVSGADKGEVYKRFRALMRSYDTHDRIDPTRITLGQYIEREWWPHARHGLQPSTATRRWHFVQNQILPQPIARVLLAQLAPRHVRTWLTAIRASGIGDGTAQGAYDVLHTIVKAALTDRYLAEDVVGAIDRPRYDAEEPEILTLPELAALLNAAQGTWWQPAIMLACVAFLRIGEVCGIKRSDIDRDACVLAIRRKVAMVNGRPLLEERTKTKKSRRVAPLDPRVLPILDAHELWLADVEQVAGDRWTDHDLLFPALGGGPHDLTSLYRPLKRLYARADVRYRPFHIFRHTGATYALRSGMSIRDVMDIGGWTNMHTLTRYTHALADLSADADRLLATPVESVFGGPLDGRLDGLTRDREVVIVK